MSKSRLEMSSGEIARILGTVGSPLIVISEMLKNSIDASATDILIKYDMGQKSIHVLDNGVGFSIENIESISKPGYSRKKINGNLKNGNGLFLTGSKGLGLLSVFSLCNDMHIDTYTETTHIQADMHRSSGELDYESENVLSTNTGTEIVLKSVSIETMDYLGTVIEIRKLMHICTYLYKNDKIKFPNIRLQIGELPPIFILTDRSFGRPTYDVTFSFQKDERELTFLCKSERDENEAADILLKAFDIGSLEKVLVDFYQIHDSILTRTNDNTPASSVNGLERVPSFEGRILVYERYGAGSELKEYGAGVNVYVNEFALYNYLSEENDWLGLADFSQRKKSTRAKPHNVFGYVNFPEFDENKEELVISNERADFIQNPVYAKFLYLLKGVVMYLLFNIDVADKNSIGSKHIKGASTQSDDTTSEENQKEPGEANAYEEAGSGNGGASNGSKSEPEDGTTGAGENERAENQGASYNPESIYKPKTPDFKHLQFTKQDGVIIDKLKNSDDLGNKIYQLVVELRDLAVQKQMYATVFVFRSLLESSTRYAANRSSGKIVFDKASLPASIGSALNHFSNICAGNQEAMKRIKLWKEAVDKRKVIDILNQYIHADQAVDTNFVEQTWKSMKPYIVFCLTC